MLDDVGSDFPPRSSSGATSGVKTAIQSALRCLLVALLYSRIPGSCQMPDAGSGCRR